MARSDATRESAIQALRMSRELSGTEGAKWCVRLMRALAEQYRIELETVSVENLTAVQALVRQLESLADSITSERELDPKIF